MDTGMDYCCGVEGLDRVEMCFCGVCLVDLGAWGLWSVMGWGSVAWLLECLTVVSVCLSIVIKYSVLVDSLEFHGILRVVLVHSPAYSHYRLMGNSDGVGKFSYRCCFYGCLVFGSILDVSGGSDCKRKMREYLSVISDLLETCVNHGSNINVQL